MMECFVFRCSHGGSLYIVFIVVYIMDIITFKLHIQQPKIGLSQQNVFQYIYTEVGLLKALIP